ncbi:YopX family protein [Clostridium felsineum]|uniref:YopX family protein n=1 Tax=Clostridium felsineum TaxID=36839 RepID=UPI00214D2185|nr:YopX family protein [Clostridium felsineum]MCR3759191.1 YopX family protein [Clostridium felsineum]
MKEVKFRAWDKITNPAKMKTWGQLLAQYQLTQVFTSGDEFFEVMQYTGIQDDTGVEIYEGDIVLKESMLVCSIKFKPFKGKVKFDEGSWWIDNGKDARLLFTETDSLKILGNIYENPELLKEEQ